MNFLCYIISCIQTNVKYFFFGQTELERVPGLTYVLSPVQKRVSDKLVVAAATESLSNTKVEHL